MISNYDSYDPRLAWWCTGQGSPSQVGAVAAAAAASMGTDWTERMDPLGAMMSCGGAMGPMICGWIGNPTGTAYPGYLKWSENRMIYQGKKYLGKLEAWIWNLGCMN